MKLNAQTPKITLNKAFLKQRPLRSEIELFKANLKTLLGKVEAKESEENKKNHVRDFLLDTYYKDKNEVNTKDRKDLVIHLGKTNDSNVGVIIEAKTPESPDRVKPDKLNVKAFHELVLYYFDERIGQGNSELKNLIITNTYEWFIFDANVFHKKIYENSKIKRLYENKINDKNDNPFFYEELRKILEDLSETIECTHFNLKDYETFLNNADLEDDKNLIELYKILSPYHLLKVPFANDSNALNKPFYDELLHIIGLEEIKDKSKTIIQRKDEARRNAGSLLENAITILKTKDSLRKVPNIADYGAVSEERYFNVALELCLTWINRILFLKLLESQLVIYHKGNPNFRFLNFETIPEFDELFTLFHQVLARTFEDRDGSIKEKYKRVPYLNSSLFDIEAGGLEEQTITIESLKDSAQLPFINSTVLRESRDKGKILNTLEYLFKFLNAYDFASEGVEDIQADNRSLINASVLGKVFEKINGYKDGSIFTPGFITMYMCRQAIRLAVVQKFKDRYQIDIDNFNDLKNFIGNVYKTEKIIEYNELINSIHLCDPAVGSGHFLVSSLNEIIAIKSELGILADTKGVRLSDFEIQIENDELIITDEKGDIFEYQINADGKPTPKAQRLQKTLFHEKQTLIENCLFGVDINPNSVKICRLRLWIELLKNAYYKESSGFAELETLPNIDINIKQGNSLLSRFALDEDLKEVLKRKKNIISTYRKAVAEYKNERNREKKRNLLEIIDEIKGDFRTEIYKHHPKMVELLKKERRLFEINSPSLFDKYSEGEREALSRNLQKEIDKIKDEIEEIKSNAIYKNAFEWRFEFPEVLDNEGNFLGFDVVIGNPPYIGANELAEKYLAFREHLSAQKRFKTLYQKWDIYIPFIELSISITKASLCALIIPFPYINQTYSKLSREFIIQENVLTEIVDLTAIKVFDEATVNNCIIFVKNEKQPSYSVKISKFKDNKISESHHLQSDVLLNKNSIIELDTRQTLNFNNKAVKTLGEYVFISKGMVLNADEIIAKGLFVKSDLINEFESKIFCRKYIEAKNIDRYQINKIRFLEWNTSRVPKLISRPTFQELYENNKILINKLGQMKATYDDNNLFCDQTIRIAVLWKDLSIVHNKSIENSIKRYSSFSRKQLEANSNHVNLKFILAILNSRLGSYLIDTIRGKGNIDINPEYLKNLPIKQIPLEEQQTFIKLVDEILEKKKLGQETADLENKIDEMVYRLYNLTNEEIAIVEGKASS